MHGLWIEDLMIVRRRSIGVACLYVIGAGLLFVIAAHRGAGATYSAPTTTEVQWSTVMIGQKQMPCLALSTDAHTWPANAIPPKYYAYQTSGNRVVTLPYVLSCVDPIVSDNDPSAPDAFVP